MITTNAFTELFPKLMEKLSVDLLVVDEGHKAKNINTKIREAIRNFPVNKIKLVLTGTPIQNNLKELYSLLDIVHEGVLGPQSNFNQTFDKPI